MTYYAPCKNCTKDATTCERRVNLKKSLRGLGVTSVKFKCPDRVLPFTPGQRVEVSFVNGDEWGDWEETWAATVIKESGSRFLCKVDDADSVDAETPAKSFFKNETLFVKVPLHRIRPLDEPPREVCSSCDAPKGEHDNSCYNSEWHGDAPIGCFNATLSEPKENSDE